MLTQIDFFASLFFTMTFFFTTKFQNFNTMKCRTNRRRGMGSLGCPAVPSPAGLQDCLRGARHLEAGQPLQGGGIDSKFLQKYHLLLLSPGLRGHTALVDPGVDSDGLCVSSQKCKTEISICMLAPWKPGLHRAFPLGRDTCMTNF